MQWALERELPDVTVVYIDTGWASSDWESEVEKGEKFAKKAGFKIFRIKPSMQFEELIKHKKGLPSERYQWCSGMLKGLPFLNWADEVDPDATATVLIGKRREESNKRASTPEFVESSEYHGGRRVWHPLYAHTERERDALLYRAGFEPLAHRSYECQPCVNANRNDLRGMTKNDIDRLRKLEMAVGKTMFRSAKHGGATGIDQVIKWARYSPGQYRNDQTELSLSCTSGMCGL